MRNMVQFQAAWLEFYRVTCSVHMYGLAIATVVPQICNYVLMNIIISPHNYL